MELTFQVAIFMMIVFGKVNVSTGASASQLIILASHFLI